MPGSIGVCIPAHPRQRHLDLCVTTLLLCYQNGSSLGNEQWVPCSFFVFHLTPHQCIRLQSGYFMSPTTDDNAKHLFISRKLIQHVYTTKRCVLMKEAMEHHMCARTSDEEGNVAG